MKSGVIGNVCQVADSLSAVQVAIESQEVGIALPAHDLGCPALVDHDSAFGSASD